MAIKGCSFLICSIFIEASCWLPFSAAAILSAALMAFAGVASATTSSVAITSVESVVVLAVVARTSRSLLSTDCITGNNSFAV